MAVILEQVLIQDTTPIFLGAYEDPNIADAFVNENPDATGEGRNSMLIHASRNYMRIKIPVRPNGVSLR